ncbi:MULTISPECIES: hypothetical protein [Photobacterium]|jgi:hypothetical protein|uniref:Uncharacterized protein n=1 Tax=Photobacterium carnosum TaxID=2023717 RepID=A0A2N4UQ08_9GAMM|nr:MULTISPECIES: hypothetical protein [Photobacterium]MBY3789365.1 hypothetical protein [Photobacterium carnosum]MCD9463260.1 hypothetical protein [Photobacterium phosphoreum]MCD9480748.1 hypothetical protein [Photobacterium phosphoreum]MCD9512336.1 hypothetical protein [Photobacterium phosphoreum]MCD9534424.1 hypothetical protein [Photobacterium carnosum]
MSNAKKPRHKRLVDELITFAEWQTERTFTYRLKRLNCLDDFIGMIARKHGENCDLSFEDWHVEEEAFFDEKLSKIANELWDADSNCPELIDPISKTKQMVVILPEPYLDQREKGNLYRLSYYSQSGASYHDVFKTFKDAVKSALMGGYNMLVAGSLDELVDTNDWNKGLVVTKAVQSGIWLREYLETIATPDERALFNI